MRLYEAYGQIVGSTAGDAFLLIGPTGAGKTAVLTVLKRAYGEGCCILPCEELMRAVVACCGAAGGPYPALHAYLDACAACRFVCVENADELTGREATTAMVRYCLQYWRRTATVIVSAIRADGTALFGQETYHTLDAAEGVRHPKRGGRAVRYRHRAGGKPPRFRSRGRWCTHIEGLRVVLCPAQKRGSPVCERTGRGGATVLRTGAAIRRGAGAAVRCGTTAACRT